MSRYPKPEAFAEGKAVVWPCADVVELCEAGLRDHELLLEFFWEAEDEEDEESPLWPCWRFSIRRLGQDEWNLIGRSDEGYSFANWPVFESWMEVRIENRGEGDAFNVTANITSAPANVTIVDGEVAVGDIPAGSLDWSSDTFTLEVDMSNPQDPCEGIFWRIEYDDAFGVHHIIENVPEFPPGEGPCD